MLRACVYCMLSQGHASVLFEGPLCISAFYLLVSFLVFVSSFVFLAFFFVLFFFLVVMLSLELCKCSPDIFLSSRVRSIGMATAYIAGYG